MRATALLAAMALAGAVLALRAIDPSAPGSLLPPCPWHALTGLLCPGCGATRALHALVHGELARAWTMNPLLLVALPLLPLMPLRADRWPAPTLRRVHALLVDARGWALLVIAFGVLRNLPQSPFAWLAPG